MKFISWQSLASKGEEYHIARFQISGHAAAALHQQDYAEIFWIESGHGVHRINGHKVKLEEGDVVWIRPTDCHSLRAAAGSAGFVITNLAFPAESLEHLRRRYFPRHDGFLWAQTSQPFCQRVGRDELKRLAAWTRHLDAAPRTKLELDRFLVDLVHRAVEGNHEPVLEKLPDWLRHGLSAIREGGRLAEGPAGLAAICRRSPEHINAILKNRLGTTTTQVLNRVRMDLAASQLRISTKSILDICFDCGLSNLGHFYKLFHEHFGMSPRQYRLRHLSSFDG